MDFPFSFWTEQAWLPKTSSCLLMRISAVRRGILVFGWELQFLDLILNISINSKSINCLIHTPLSNQTSQGTWKQVVQPYEMNLLLPITWPWKSMWLNLLNPSKHPDMLKPSCREPLFKPTDFNWKSELFDCQKCIYWAELHRKIISQASNCRLI